jgi:hypothetical protein
MAFGQQGGETGGQRLDYLPQGLPSRKDAERVKLRQSSSAAQLSRLALGGFAVSLALVLAPFTVIPAINGYALNGADPARMDPSAEGSAEVQSGPSYVKRKLGFGSSADGRCARIWDREDSTGFRGAMHCYATYKVSRLCDVPEKQAFLALTGEYFRAENGLAFAHVVDTLAAKGRLPMTQQPVKSGSDVVKAYRDLAEKGFITLDDFGWTAPLSLRLALKDIDAVKSPCPPG